MEGDISRQKEKSKNEQITKKTRFRLKKKKKLDMYGSDGAKDCLTEIHSHVLFH